MGLGNNSENLQNLLNLKDFMLSGLAPKWFTVRNLSEIEPNVSETYSGISTLSNDFFEKIYHLNQLYEKFLKKAVNSGVFRLLKFRCQTR